LGICIRREGEAIFSMYQKRTWSIKIVLKIPSNPSIAVSVPFSFQTSLLLYFKEKRSHTGQYPGFSGREGVSKKNLSVREGS